MFGHFSDVFHTLFHLHPLKKETDVSGKATVGPPVVLQSSFSHH